ncbi:hypothetical protein GE09DRAFT_1057641 [Coniochaeta sp. 2T2.1]|nr:hypothetical protein GE09DRAFT_1057641 [Coniochaeta sp. 2T2.1]
MSTPLISSSRFTSYSFQDLSCFLPKIPTLDSDATTWDVLQWSKVLYLKCKVLGLKNYLFYNSSACPRYSETERYMVLLLIEASLSGEFIRELHRLGYDHDNLEPKVIFDFIQTVYRPRFSPPVHQRSGILSYAPKPVSPTHGERVVLGCGLNDLSLKAEDGSSLRQRNHIASGLITTSQLDTNEGGLEQDRRTATEPQTKSSVSKPSPFCLPGSSTGS